jgi:hypothetical protein
MLKDVSLEKSRPLKIEGYNVFWEPSWAENETVVAAIGTDSPDAIALIDVSEHSYAKIKEILWRKGDGPDVQPFYPLYSVATRRCVFVGLEPKGKALYSFRHGQPDPPRRLELEGHDNLLQDLASSPDGRYVLFTSDRRVPGEGDVAPGETVPES